MLVENENVDKVVRLTKHCPEPPITLDLPRSKGLEVIRAAVLGHRLKFEPATRTNFTIKSLYMVQR